ncbi:MAG: hypothetical protein HQK51_14880 [Oligoflexia bacterium]|nr:hypothetical protein [Oligoflexia bacterium]
MKFLILIFLFFILSACAPTIYFVDKESIMETEAAGNWPSFEEFTLQKTEKIGASFLAPVEEDIRTKRFNKVLNGELQ